MMFVILCNFKGGVNFDYSILVYYMFHMLYFTILYCTVYSILVYYTFTQIIISTSPCNLTFTLCVLYAKHIFLLSLYRFKLRFCSLLLRFAWWLHNIRLTTYERDSFIFFGAFQQHQTESYVPIVVLCCILSEKHKILKYFASILSDLQPKAFARLIP